MATNKNTNIQNLAHYRSFVIFNKNMAVILSHHSHLRLPWLIVASSSAQSPEKSSCTRIETSFVCTFHGVKAAKSASFAITEESGNRYEEVSMPPFYVLDCLG